MSSSLSIFESALDGVVKDEFISVLDKGTLFLKKRKVGLFRNRIIKKQTQILQTVHGHKYAEFNY